MGLHISYADLVIVLPAENDHRQLDRIEQLAKESNVKINEAVTIIENVNTTLVKVGAEIKSEIAKIESAGALTAPQVASVERLKTLADGLDALITDIEPEPVETTETPAVETGGQPPAVNPS